MIRTLSIFLSIGLTTAAMADAPLVEDATAHQTSAGWRFDVTIRHPDTGWDHYADGWAVLDADGNELGYRTLLHPHETEQPFTRSLSGVKVPAGIDRVFIRAHCLVTGNSDHLFEVALNN